ncbi:MAG: hypothetical protein IPK17_19325 [Chloroflexi bacterium]|uniref:hypothetical protein n=1 Tax=Candidatus Flexifilum breve TaxID=3140694 RepID=UPI003134A225|nr:hypothetical protein [Chloroflexota bacterium]
MTSVLTKSTLPARRAHMLALAWAPFEARTALFADRLQVPVFFVHFLLYKRPYIAPFKYVLQAFKTWAILLRERPQLVYVLNPPVFAPLCVWLYSLFTGTKLVIDTHPPALYSRKWAWTVPLQRFVIKRAYLNIIDQERFADQFRQWGAQVVTLTNPPRPRPEKIIELERAHSVDKAAEQPKSTVTRTRQDGLFEVAVVNTFAADEPLDIILQAAYALPDAHFSIMGDLSMAPADVHQSTPPNVTFTGYLRGEAYWDALRAANAVMVLTTYPYSVLGGAQDGVTLGKPLLLSDQPALREFFTSGVVFIPNTAGGIVAGVRAVMRDETHLIQAVKWLALQQEAAWQARFGELLRAIEQA